MRLTVNAGKSYWHSWQQNQGNPNEDCTLRCIFHACIDEVSVKVVVPSEEVREFRSDYQSGRCTDVFTVKVPNLPARPLCG
jgi:hypothetical protein